MSVPGDDYVQWSQGQLPGLTGKESHIELVKYHLEAAQTFLEEADSAPDVVGLVIEALDLLYGVRPGD
ncbi:hypothetical protein [Acetobacter sp. KSO5]|uniref:hypothetical protein n=1 Tax=Acetobacter sp. KSO5 TaxID=3373674 RepID=UPI00376ECC70